jgi:hypothetical protein
MPSETLFDAVARELEARTHLDALAARGTLRLALKEAGLEPRTVTGKQMVVAIVRLLPRELQSRGVEEPEAVCQALVGALRNAVAPQAAAEPEGPEAVFRRMREGRPASS